MLMSTYTMVQTILLSLTDPLRYGTLWKMLSCLLPQMLSLFWCTPCLYFCFLFCQLWSTPRILISSCNKCIDLMEDWRLSWGIKVKCKGVGFYISALFMFLMLTSVLHSLCNLKSSMPFPTTFLLVGNLPGQFVILFHCRVWISLCFLWWARLIT